MRIIVAIGALSLFACAPANEESAKPTAPEAPPAELSEGCDASAGQYALGKPFTDDLAAELQAKTGAKSVRVIPPDTAVTMDYRGDRLNIGYDEKKTINKVDCG